MKFNFVRLNRHGLAILCSHVLINNYKNSGNATILLPYTYLCRFPQVSNPLSLMDPRDKIVLWTELNEHCDKLQRSNIRVRRYCQLKLTDDGPVNHAPSVHLCRAKSIARFDDRYAVAKFSMSRVSDKVPDGSILIFANSIASRG